MRYIMPKTNSILAGSSTSFVIVRAGMPALSSTQPAHMTPPQSDDLASTLPIGAILLGDRN
jgi:hypothetical protein